MSINPRELELESGPIAEGGEIALSGSPWRLVGRTFAQNRLAIVGVGLIVALFAFSFLGPLIYHTDQLDPNLSAVNQPPGAGFPFGADAANG